MAAKSISFSIVGCNKSAPSRGKLWTYLIGSLSAETDDCVVWPFWRDRKGYGLIEVGGRKFRAHRIACVKAHGQPPTPKHQAAHSCGKGHLGCINWRHLAWKSPAENAADKLVHGTDSRGEKAGTAKLTEADVLEIRRLRGVETQTALARMFGVDRSNIGLIQRRKNWGWLP